jgi:hypothetical protein
LHWAFWIGFGLGLVKNCSYWLGARLKALYGDVNPALVVSTDPYLIAVLANLDAVGDLPKPVIKVLSHPLQRMTGGPPQVNTPLATVASYDGECEGYWTDFFPEVINCITTDTSVIRRVVATIGEDEWDQLTDGLNQLRRPYRKRIYTFKGRKR